MKEIEAWLARDYNGSIYIYTEKPQKLLETWFVRGLCFMKLDDMKLDDSLFPEVQWSDDEPTKVKLVIEM